MRTRLELNDEGVDFQVDNFEDESCFPDEDQVTTETDSDSSDDSSSSSSEDERRSRHQHKCRKRRHKRKKRSSRSKSRMRDRSRGSRSRSRSIDKLRDRVMAEESLSGIRSLNELEDYLLQHKDIVDWVNEKRKSICHT